MPDNIGAHDVTDTSTPIPSNASLAPMKLGPLQPPFDDRRDGYATGITFTDTSMVWPPEIRMTPSIGATSA